MNAPMRKTRYEERQGVNDVTVKERGLIRRLFGLSTVSGQDDRVIEGDHSLCYRWLLVSLKHRITYQLDRWLLLLPLLQGIRYRCLARPLVEEM